MYYFGLDIGTTGCKSMLFDEVLDIISEDYIEYDLIYSDNGMAQQSPTELWEMTKLTIKNTLAASKVPPEKIKAMSISSQGISFVPMNKDGKEHGNLISWLDTRAKEQTEQIEDIISENYIFETTGKRISPSYTLPKIMWLKENNLEIYQNTYKFLMVLDYITYKLTGEIKTDYSMASGTMMFDITQCEWDEKILHACGIEKDKLPDIAETGTPIGSIKPNVASELGLNSNTVVVLGAQDQKCAALGSGIKEGIATVSLGTSTAISILCKEPVLDAKKRIPCFALDKTSWILEAVIGTSGAVFKWMRNLLDMGYDDMCRLAEQSPTGSNGVFFYPHLAGAGSPYWKGEAKGSFHGITLNTGKPDMIRSLLESIAFQIKINIDAAEDITGTKINEIRLFGGGSKQAFWVQMTADVTGLPVSTLYTLEAANVGAAMLAAKGTKAETDISSDKLIQRKYNPQKEAKEKYYSLIKDYMKIQSKFI